jgi:hypothetical protein
VRSFKFLVQRYLTIVNEATSDLGTLLSLARTIMHIFSIWVDLLS